MAGRSNNKEEIKDKKDLETIMAEKEQQLEAENSMSDLEKRKMERQKQREKLKKINDDTTIYMYCNAGNTEVFYECPKTHQTYQMTYGDVEPITFQELKTMKALHRGMLENYILVPIDVDSEEFELDDVLKMLQLDALYEDEMLFEDNIDYILNNLKYETFELLLKQSKKPYFNRIVDRALQLAKEHKFNDFQKMNCIEKIKDYPDMFKESIENNEQFK